VHDPASRIQPKELEQLVQSKASLKIIDVRSPVEFEICHLPESINVPLADLLANPAEWAPGSETLVTVCRLGNDSQIAVDALRSTSDNKDRVKDLVGGLVGWSRTVDENFPIY